MKIKIKDLLETFQNFAQEVNAVSEAEEPDFDPDKTGVVKRDNTSNKLEKDFVVTSNMKEMEKEGWIFQRDPNGGWIATNPHLKKEVKLPTDKEEDFVTKNKDKFKKIYGTNYKKYLYGVANKKFGKKDTKTKKEK